MDIYLYIYIYTYINIHKAKIFLPSHHACNRTPLTSRSVPSHRALCGGRGDKPLLTNELSKTKQNIERNTSKNVNDYYAAEHVNDKNMTITG